MYGLGLVRYFHVSKPMRTTPMGYVDNMACLWQGDKVNSSNRLKIIHVGHSKTLQKQKKEYDDTVSEEMVQLQILDEKEESKGAKEGGEPTVESESKVSSDVEMGGKTSSSEKKPSSMRQGQCELRLPEPFQKEMKEVDDAGTSQDAQFLIQVNEKSKGVKEGDGSTAESESKITTYAEIDKDMSSLDTKSGPLYQEVPYEVHHPELLQKQKKEFEDIIPDEMVLLQITEENEEMKGAKETREPTTDSESKVSRDVEVSRETSCSEMKFSPLCQEVQDMQVIKDLKLDVWEPCDVSCPVADKHGDYELQEHVPLRINVNPNMLPEQGERLVSFKVDFLRCRNCGKMFLKECPREDLVSE